MEGRRRKISISRRHSLFSSPSWCFSRKLISWARHTRSAGTWPTRPPYSSLLSYLSRWCEDGEYLHCWAPCTGLISTTPRRRMCSAAFQFDQTCSVAFPFGPPCCACCWKPLCFRFSWFDCLSSRVFLPTAGSIHSHFRIKGSVWIFFNFFRIDVCGLSL